MNADKIIEKISSKRIADNLWQLVNIKSPTSNERQVAFVFAEMLKKAGAAVEVDETIYNSPNVIGRLKGSTQGKIIQLAAHLDHIDIPHPPPEKQENTISGRGSADMKNGLAGILEIVSTLNESGCDFPGEILVTTYGLHEAPVGDSKGLLSLIEKNIKGDAAIVFEGPDDKAAIMANGMAIWNITITHAGSTFHELCTDKDKHELLSTAVSIANLIQQQDQAFKTQTNKFPLLPKPSFFIGQLHFGDFYNRVPDHCTMQGTRRWQPDTTFEQIQQQFQAILDQVNHPKDIAIKNNWMFVGPSYQISPDEEIVKSLCRSYKKVYDKEMPIMGHSSVTDTCRLARIAKIPAVLCGFGTDTGHADFEYVKIDHMTKCCKVALLTVLDYLS